MSLSQIPWAAAEGSAWPPVPLGVRETSAPSLAVFLISVKQKSLEMQAGRDGEGVTGREQLCTSKPVTLVTPRSAAKRTSNAFGLCKALYWQQGHHYVTVWCSLGIPWLSSHSHSHSHVAFYLETQDLLSGDTSFLCQPRRGWTDSSPCGWLTSVPLLTAQFLNINSTPVH